MAKNKINVEAVRKFRRLYPEVPQRKLAKLMEEGAAIDCPGFNLNETAHIHAAALASGTGRFYQYYNIIRRHDRLERMKKASTVTGRVSRYNVALLQSGKYVVVSVAAPAGTFMNYYVGLPGVYEYNGGNTVPRESMLKIGYKELTNFDVDGPVVGLVHGHADVLCVCTATSAYLVCPTQGDKASFSRHADPTSHYAGAYPLLWKAGK